jgi:outer membrane lipoprotein carrier protein
VVVISSLLVSGGAVAESPAPTGVDATVSPSDHPARSATSSPACTDERAVEIAGLVQKRYDAIQDFEADFSQTSQSVVLSGPSLADVESMRGRVVFGKMRWSYEEPEPSLVVSDGETLWIYDPGAKQANKMSVQSGYLAGAALQFLLGEGSLRDSFLITVVRCADDHVEIDLLPREPASYERLGLTAQASDGLIVDTTIVDLFGSRTRIAFEKVRFDQSPDAALFTFEPPEGVEVIDLSVQPMQ